MPKKVKDYLETMGIAGDIASAIASRKKRQRDEENRAAKSVKRAYEKSSKEARIRAARQKYGTTSAKLLSAYTPSELNYFKVKGRAAVRRKQQKADTAARKVEDRMLQLAGMPKNRGRKELKRIAETGSLKETASEKKRRERIEQLKGMPKGRGKKLAAALESFGNDKKTDSRPTTMTQPGGPGKKSPGTADGSQAPKPAEEAKVTKAKKQMVSNQYAKAAEEKRKKAQAEAIKKQQEEQKKKAMEAVKRAEAARTGKK